MLRHFRLSFRLLQLVKIVIALRKRGISTWYISLLSGKKPSLEGRIVDLEVGRQALSEWALTNVIKQAVFQRVIEDSVLLFGIVDFRDCVRNKRIRVSATDIS